MTETVHFRADTFRATIYLPRLHELTITNIRKLLRLVFCYDWENEEAIQTTELYIPNAVEDSLQAWKEKSQEYAHGWRNLKGPFAPRLTKEEKLKVTRENNRLTAAVKEAKRTHEKWVKINSVFHELRQ